MKSTWRFRSFITVTVIFVYILTMLLLPAPRPVVSLSVTSGTLDTGRAKPMPWPSTGGGAVGISGGEILAGSNADTSMPTASIAKVVLAMATLRKMPLKVDEAGPVITFTEKDTAIYNANLAMNGSVVPVRSGEQLSEYQALQALLLPSGNNIASSLANWAFGSEQQYISYATAMLQNLGLSKTHIADASGFSPKTVSTPRELVLLGEEALKIPPLAQIVSQKQAILPVAGVVRNHNTDLGQYDINGLKTGNSDEAGGCLLFSATRKIDGKDVTLVGALQSLSNLQQALSVAPALVESGYLNLRVASLPVHIGTMTAPWAAPVNIIAAHNLEQAVWNGAILKRDIVVYPSLNGITGHAKLGTLTSDLKLESNIPQPSLWWRLTHPLQIIKGTSGGL